MIKILAGYPILYILWIKPVEFRCKGKKIKENTTKC